MTDKSLQRKFSQYFFSLLVVLVGCVLNLFMGQPAFAEPLMVETSMPRTASIHTQNAASQTIEADDRPVEKQNRTRELNQAAKNVNKNTRNEPGQAAGGIQGTIENVKEKLNLNEPLPQSTKDFLKDVKGDR